MPVPPVLAPPVGPTPPVGATPAEPPAPVPPVVPGFPVSRSEHANARATSAVVRKRAALVRFSFFMRFLPDGSTLPLAPLCRHFGGAVGTKPTNGIFFWSHERARTPRKRLEKGRRAPRGRGPGRVSGPVQGLSTATVISSHRGGPCSREAASKRRNAPVRRLRGACVRATMAGSPGSWSRSERAPLRARPVTRPRPHPGVLPLRTPPLPW